MGGMILTPRQRAEREFYQVHARLHAPETVTFDPVLGRQRRPWNSYWFVYEQARAFYQAGARKVLDFGCGKGVVAVRLARIGFEVSGFDISPNNIEVARRLAERYGFTDRTDFSVQVAEQLDYPDACFDLIVGMDILHHVEVPAAVAQAMRVLRPGGAAVFREHLAVPVLEWLRHSWPARRLVPPGESLERNITRYERKLTRADLADVRRLCPDVRIHRFTLLSRLGVFFDGARNPWPGRLERLDARLFKALPFLRPLGATAVIVLHKCATPRPKIPLPRESRRGRV
ncbi:MAG: class I SAM-dependent methyltransferase [Phycisphaerae bacterium]|jgi:SAM-dependent methyltransferase